MFPLRKRKLIRGIQAHINAGLEGAADYVANKDELFLPFDGIVKRYYGKQGGNWLRLTRANGDKIEMAHLDKYLIPNGGYEEGTKGAFTGNTGQLTTGPHLHIQIIDKNGNRLDPEAYDWNPMQLPIMLKTQVIFNNQKWGNELTELASVQSRMSYLSVGNIALDFLPSVYTNFQNIPAGVYMEPISAERDTAVMRDWYESILFPLAPTADVVIFVGKKGDWQWQLNEGGQILSTYGHFYSDNPAVFPLMIQIVAEQGDVSWKWPQLSALTHYIPHEITHGVAQNSGGQDLTHQYDYGSVDGLTQLYPNLDYSKIYYSLTHKVAYPKRSIMFKKQGDGTIYFLAGNKLVPFASSYESFLKDFPDAVVVELSPNEFIKFKLANFLVVKER